jgi:thioredoxin-like negative regulator of GroEL
MISYLSPNDFFVTLNKELSHIIKGFSIVFFTSDTCQHCHNIAPAFKAASDSIKGCTFAVMNVDQNNMQVVRMSQHTRTVLQYVPLIVMYANGISVAVFNPDESNPGANLDLLKQFIDTTTAAIRSSRGTEHQPNITQTSSNDQSRVCDTSTGIAICGPRSKQVCYLPESIAYSSRSI